MMATSAPAVASGVDEKLDPDIAGQLRPGDARADDGEHEQARAHRLGDDPSQQHAAADATTSPSSVAVAQHTAPVSGSTVRSWPPGISTSESTV